MSFLEELLHPNDGPKATEDANDLDQPLVLQLLYMCDDLLTGTVPVLCLLEGLQVVEHNPPNEDLAPVILHAVLGRGRLPSTRLLAGITVRLLENITEGGLVVIIVIFTFGGLVLVVLVIFFIGLVVIIVIVVRVAGAGGIHSGHGGYGGHGGHGRLGAGGGLRTPGFQGVLADIDSEAAKVLSVTSE